MTKVTTVTCDMCGKDLTRTGNEYDYRIVLANEEIPSWGGAATSMAAYPHFKGGPKHFCCVNCLKGFVERL